MTFLAPFALIGLLLLSIPIIVHLFKPRKMRQTPFSSLRWLKETHQRLSRRVQWHQWLLFLLRAGCIALLVLALAKPLIGSRSEARSTDRFVVVDASRSMSYQMPDQATPLERAADLAGKLAQAARPGDRTAVIVAGSTPHLIVPPSADASGSLAKIKAIKPSLADASLSATLPLVRSLIAGKSEREVELVFLTDNLKTRWQQHNVQAFLKDQARPVRVKIIETGAGSAQNAWIASARLFRFGANEDRWIRVDVGCVGDQAAARGVRLTGIAGAADDTQAITLRSGQVAHVDFRIPASVSLQGQVAELRLKPSDALPSDDLFFLNLDTAIALRVLLVEPEGESPDGRSVGLYLRAGMQALDAARNQAFDLTTRTSSSVTASDFQKADVILLASAPDLSDSALEGLEMRLRSGAGLAMFLGPRIKPAFYQEKLFRPHQPAEGLLPLDLKSGSGWIAEGTPGSLTNIRWTHPLLASLHDPLLSDLTQSRFRFYASLVGAIGKTDTILARFDDDVPAILERPLGAGRVLVFNTTANDEWSDLPRRKSFVPLLDRTLAYLSAGGVKRSFTTGDALNLPLPDYQAGNDVTVVTPSGAKITRSLLSVRGQTQLHLSELAEAGVYRVEGAGKKNFAFTVNTGRTDSGLSPMDAKALEAWWAPATVEIVSAETAAQQLEQQANAWPVWPALVALAALLLLAESVYVHRLCPRANPKAADAVVPQRGVMRPVR